MFFYEFDSLVIKGGGSTANSFLKAQDSLMERLYTKKMQPNPTKSFQSSLGAAIATIVQESNLALFYGISSVRNYKVRAERTPFKYLWPETKTLKMPNINATVCISLPMS